MKAGALRQLIDIESPTETSTASGAISSGWTLFATVRAEIVTRAGKELFGAGEEFMAEATHDVTIRYLPGTVAKMRINFKTDAQRAAGKNGRLFDILLVDDVEERHREMDLTCKETTRGHGI